MDINQSPSTLYNKSTTKAGVKMKLQHSVLALFLASSVALAADLTPEQYIEIEIRVRTATLEQLKEKVSGEESDTDYVDWVRSVYKLYDVTSGEHLRYGNKHQKQIDTWLSENQDKQDELDQLATEFSELIAQAEGAE